MLLETIFIFHLHQDALPSATLLLCSAQISLLAQELNKVRVTGYEKGCAEAVCSAQQQVFHNKTHCMHLHCTEALHSNTAVPHRSRYFNSDFINS